ncbi:uncharacterized protein LOC110450990 [Mizuhopecten yessoensis]|uniref:uncharacterized protein LOC110450990 n=1 Tax=Mizuhopecten yessoensis TaxID=6573 RepID=UPI000B45E38C|nr:uncharacterized protein LOC110450990 [Mizuhopecten yessoensis]
MGLYRYLLVCWSVVWTLTVVNASVNIASGKATNQSSVLHNWDSSKAVDGCVLTNMQSNCCTHTAAKLTEVWWQVDLQTQSVIESVNIIYRDENNLARLAGYEIFLSNTQDWTLGTRCHKDTTAELGSMAVTQYITCPGVSRYLTIYNDRRVKAKRWYSTDAILALCEVQVYGCPVGKYGNGNCNNDCMNCVNNTCDATSGTCDVCTAGYYKIGGICVQCPVNCAENKCDSFTGACSECKAGYHGSTCTQTCPTNCKDSICIQVNRFCTECAVGYHGDQCDMNCPFNCKDKFCNQTNGRCIGCGPDYHGSDCSLNCPDNCKDHACIQENGRCIECVSGFHGSKCVNMCGYCQDGRCDKDTGTCMTSCIDGLTGHRCDIKVVTLPSKEDDFKAAAVGIGSVFGVVIVALVIVIIVQARRHRSMNNQNTTRSTTMTDISLPSIGQERRAETDGTYAVIGAQERDKNITKMSAGDSSYEQLGYRERDVPHLYETT